MRIIITAAIAAGNDLVFNKSEPETLYLNRGYLLAIYSVLNISCSNKVMVKCLSLLSPSKDSTLNCDPTWPQACQKGSNEPEVFIYILSRYWQPFYNRLFLEVGPEEIQRFVSYNPRFSFSLSLSWHPAQQVQARLKSKTVRHWHDVMLAMAEEN